MDARASALLIFASAAAAFGAGFVSGSRPPATGALESLPDGRLVSVVVHRDGSSFTLQVPREKLPSLGLLPVRGEP